MIDHWHTPVPDIDVGHLRLLYQPMVCARTLRTLCLEALLRWERPGHAMVLPDDFVPGIERSAQIHVIGDWVVREAARQACAWRASGAPMKIAFNVSVAQMQSESFVTCLTDALNTHALPGNALEVEVTESLPVTDWPAARRSARRLRQLGIELAVDDFGRGYSSLRRLRSLRAGVLKLDKSLTAQIDRSERCRSVVRALTNIAHSAGARTVAEGVEREDQFDTLCGLGCDIVQGFLFGRPRPPESADAALASRSPIESSTRAKEIAP